MEKKYLKLTNHDIFAQIVIPRASSFNLKYREMTNYYPKTTKLSNNSPMKGFYSTKNLFSNKTIININNKE